MLLCKVKKARAQFDYRFTCVISSHLCCVHQCSPACVTFLYALYSIAFVCVPCNIVWKLLIYLYFRLELYIHNEVLVVYIDPPIIFASFKCVSQQRLPFFQYFNFIAQCFFLCKLNNNLFCFFFLLYIFNVIKLIKTKSSQCCLLLNVLMHTLEL